MLIFAVVDPSALVLVVGGSLVLAALQAGWPAARCALDPLRAADPQQEADAARRLIHAADAALSHRGLFAAETLAPEHAHLRCVLAELADARDCDNFSAALGRLEHKESAQDALPARFWCAVADAAPALGMVGTVAGMMGMAQGSIGSPDAADMSALALALTSTLYGLLMSAVLAAPLAARAARLAEARADWRAELASALKALVARETGRGK